MTREQLVDAVNCGSMTRSCMGCKAWEPRGCFKAVAAEALAQFDRAERLLKAGDELFGQMEDNKHAIHWRDTFPATDCWTNKRNFEAAMAEWERVAADG